MELDKTKLLFCDEESNYCSILVAKEAKIENSSNLDKILSLIYFVK